MMPQEKTMRLEKGKMMPQGKTKRPEPEPPAIIIKGSRFPPSMRHEDEVCHETLEERIAWVNANYGHKDANRNGCVGGNSNPLPPLVTRVLPEPFTGPSLNKDSHADPALYYTRRVTNLKSDMYEYGRMVDSVEKALQEYNKIEGTDYRLIGIKKASWELVNGTNYHIVFQAVNSTEEQDTFEALAYCLVINVDTLESRNQVEAVRKSGCGEWHEFPISDPWDMIS